ANPVPAAPDRAGRCRGSPTPRRTRRGNVDVFTVGAQGHLQRRLFVDRREELGDRRARRAPDHKTTASCRHPELIEVLLPRLRICSVCPAVLVFSGFAPTDVLARVSISPIEGLDAYRQSKVWTRSSPDGSVPT